MNPTLYSADVLTYLVPRAKKKPQKARCNGRL